MEPKKQEYKTQGNMGLFDDERTLEKLNDMGNPLDRLSGVIDFEMFRDILEKALHKDNMTKAGAKPYDPVLMFKILVLQGKLVLGMEVVSFFICNISFQ